MFIEFQDPFRRDRIVDSHGGVIVYVKRGIPCKRRLDLELVNIECVWIEIIVKNKKLLIGTFYRPPTASPIVISDIENSVGLINDPTHYTETSFSIIDIVLVSNSHSVELSGVSEPFLSQDFRNHCPVYVIFSFKKPLLKSFLRELWLYNQGGFNLF